MISEAELTRGKQIAQGSFGVVHAGTWGHIDVAIKTYIDHGDPSALDEFQKEAEFMQSIRHPNMVRRPRSACTFDVPCPRARLSECDPRGCVRSSNPASLLT